MMYEERSQAACECKELREVYRNTGVKWPCPNHIPTSYARLSAKHKGEYIDVEPDACRDWLDQNTRWRVEGSTVWIEQESLLNALAKKG